MHDWMNLLGPMDWVIISVIILLMFLSFFKGFIREVISLSSWCIALLMSFTYATWLGEHLLKRWVHTPSVRWMVAWFIILIAFLIIGGFIKLGLHRLVQRTGLSSTDRFLGMIFGFFKALLILTVAVWLIGKTPLTQDPWWQNSRLLPYFVPLEHWLKRHLDYYWPRTSVHLPHFESESTMQLNSEDTLSDTLHPPTSPAISVGT